MAVTLIAWLEPEATGTEQDPARDTRTRGLEARFPWAGSLETIYSTLGVLERSGLIQELPFERMSRYEANMEPHVNLVCIQCENVMDADAGQETVVRLRNRITRESDFEVAWQRVDFYGWCPRCAAAKRAAEPSPV